MSLKTIWIARSIAESDLWSWCRRNRPTFAKSILEKSGETAYEIGVIIKQQNEAKVVID